MSTSVRRDAARAPATAAETSPAAAQAGARGRRMVLWVAAALVALLLAGAGFVGGYVAGAARTVPRATVPSAGFVP